MVDDIRNQDEEIEEIVSCGLKSIFYQNLVDRYFVRYYLNKGQANEQYIFIHSNGVMMCGLGRNNDFLKERVTQFIDLDKVTKVSGKKKHGAKILNEKENIVELINQKEKKIKFSPLINKGKLMEINWNLSSTPHLINESVTNLT